MQSADRHILGEFFQNVGDSLENTAQEAGGFIQNALETYESEGGPPLP